MIKIWDLATGVCVATLEGHGDAVRSLAVLAGGRLASASDDWMIKIWDLATHTCVATLEGHEETVEFLVVLADGRLASASADRMIKIWDLATDPEWIWRNNGWRNLACVATLYGHEEVWSLAVLEGGRLASGFADQKIKIWDSALSDRRGVH